MFFPTLQSARHWLFVGIAWLALGPIGCGGGGSGAPPAPPATPTIVTQPASLDANQGQTATFSVIARGAALSYQWKKDGTNMANATSASFSIAGVQPSDAGSYTVVVSNGLGSTASTVAILIVRQPSANIPPVIASVNHAVGTVVIHAKTEVENDQPQMDFYLDDLYVGTSSSNPYYIIQPTQGLTYGTHHAKAVALKDGIPIAASSPMAFQIESVHIYPENPETPGARPLQFRAVDRDEHPLTVNWSIQEGDAGGTIDNAGKYNAPQAPGTYHVIATNQSDATQWAAVAVQVVASTSASGVKAPLLSTEFSPAAAATVSTAVLTLSPVAGRIVSIEWAASEKTTGPYEIYRTLVGSSSSPFHFASSSNITGILFDDVGIQPGASYTYEIQDSLGNPLTTASITLPEIRLTATSVRVHWDQPGRTGFATIKTHQGKVVQFIPYATDLVFANLVPDTGYILSFEFSDRLVHTYPFMTLPAQPQLYAAPNHVTPGDSVDIAIFNPHPEKPIELLVKRTNPQPATLATETINAAGAPCPYDGSVYGYEWPTAFRWQVPLDAPSGLYYVSIGYPGENAYTRYPILVEPGAGSNNKLLVLADTYTWQAYNEFGGVSFYLNQISFPFPRTSPLFGHLAPRPELSFHRPYFGPDPLNYLDRTAGQSRFLLDWLDMHNYTYDLVSDQTLSVSDPATMSSHYQTVIVQVHPEYWAQAEMSNLQEYISLGGHLINLAGNENYCRVAEIDNPSRLARLTRPNVAQEVRPFNGVFYSEPNVNRYGNFAILKPNHWVFNNLPTSPWPSDTFGNGGPFGGGSGDEIDATGPGSPAGLVMLAEGSQYDPLRAEVLIFDSGNGSVFTASSVTFTSTLASDPITSQMLMNLLATFAPGSKK